MRIIPNQYYNQDEVDELIADHTNTADKITYSGVDVVETVEDTLDDYYNFRQIVNGTFKESFDCVVTVSGSSIYAELEQSGGGDLTCQFSDGYTTLDCTPAQTIELTAGTTTVPQDNYVYVLQSTKALTVSTSAWPDTEHIKAAFLCVADASFTNTYGALVNQNWNDHLYGTDNMGHITHMAERSRRLGAAWYSGITGAGTDDYTTSSAGTVHVKVNSGILYQMHKHTYTAKDTSVSDVVHIINHDVTPYTTVSNLYDVVNDASGGTLTNKYFNIVLWGVANKTGEYSPLIVNLPTGSYNVQSDAENDVDSYDVLAVPTTYLQESSTAFLICRMTFRKTGGTWDYKSTVDLRGTKPSTVTGGTLGTITDFADNQFTVFDGNDNTRIITLSADNITTGNTRVITMADDNVDLANVHAESHTIVSHSDTSATGTELNTLTDGSNADSLHIHEAYLELDGTDLMAGNLDMNSNNIDNVGILETNEITRVGGNLIIDVNSASTLRWVQIRNDGFSGTASLSVETDLTVGGDISLGGTVDGVNIASHASNADAHHNESHTVVSHSDTTATGANLNTLVGSGITGLHSHKERHVIDFGQRNTGGSDYWDTYTLVSGYAGYRATTVNRAGSVVEFSFTCDLNSVTNPGNFECEIYAGALGASASMIKEEVVAISSTGYIQVSELYTPGTYTFNADDMIALYGRLAGGLTGTWRYGVARIIIEYDT